MSLLPLGLSHSAHAQAVNTWTASNDDWNIAADWSLGIVPNGAGGVFYAVNNSNTNNTLTHSSSTGAGGVDTIYSFVNAGTFNLTGGILAGSKSNAASTFVNNGTTNINGGTLRNFTVSGTPLGFSGSNGNVLDSDVFQNNINLNGGIARILNSLTIQTGSSANISAGGYLSVANNSTLIGTVNFTDGNGSNALGTESGDTLTLAAGSLVHGITGQVGVAEVASGSGTVVNHGTISSDGGGTIYLNAGASTTSDGTLQAKNASTLRLDSALNSTGGTLNVLDTSQILDNGVAVTGGTVTGTGHMTFTGSNGNVLTGLTFNGATLDLTNGGIARIVNTLTLTGGSTANIASGGYLSAANNSTLTGTVNFTDGNGSNALGTESGDTLTLAAGSLVHGITGQVGVAEVASGSGTVVNHGTISSDGGGTIYLNPGAGTSNDGGTLQAKKSGANGSTLRLDSAVTNTNGGLLNIADTVSTITDNGVAVTGGTVTGTGHMTFTGSNGNVLTGLTFNGATLDLTNGGIARIVNTLTLTGGSTANIASGGYLSAADNGTTHIGTLSGTVNFTDGNGSNALGTEGGDTLTLAAGSLVHGITGQVGVAEVASGSGTVVNHGTISSDGGGTIYLNAGASTTSDGTLQAKNASTLRLDSALNSTGGTLNVLDTSQILDNGVAVTGGTVTGTGHMTFTGSNGNVLTGLTFNGATLDLTNGGIARIVNTLTLTGGSTANIASGGYLSAADNGTTHIGTLSGTVNFTDGNGSNALGTEGGDTLTLAAGSLVHGITGQVGVAEVASGSGTVVNHGTISSDGGGTIYLNPGAGTSNDGGTLQAKKSGANGSTLRLDSAVTNINGGSLNVADTASVIQNNGVNITGGTVTGPGRMTFTGGGSDFLTGVTFSGATLDLSNGNYARFVNGLTLTGGSAANIASGGILSANTSGTLTGTVNFTDGNGSNALGTEGGDTLTLAAGSLVHGITGQVGVAQFIGGNGTVVNNGTIKSDGGGTITINPANLTNGTTGTIQATGGAVTITPTLNNAGTVLISAGNTITANSGETQTGGVTQVDGTFTVSNAPVAINGGTLKGIGIISGNVTVTGGDVAPGDSPGTLAVNGNYTQTGGALDIEYTASRTVPTAHDLLTVSGTATVGGILNISFLGPNVNGNYLATPGEPGTSFDFLTFGTLGNTGGLASLFTNEYAVGANYFVNGIPSNGTSAGPAVYQLTQNGGALHLTLTTAAAPEPSQWAAFGLGALGLACLGGRARRRAARGR